MPWEPDPDIKGVFHNNDGEGDEAFTRVQFSDGMIEIFLDKIAIYKGGITGRKNRVDIPFGHSSSIDIQRAGLLSPGGMWFTTAGHHGRDPNLAVFFSKGQNDLAEATRDLIFECAQKYQEMINTPPPPQQQSSPADELTKLKGLLDQGILSQGEFDQAKQGILRRLAG